MPLSVSEPTESPSSMADLLQASRAAWRSAAATRHRRPAQRGQGRQTHATSLPATARTQPRTPFTSPRLPSSPAAAAAVAIADASSTSPLLHHRSCTTSTPMTRRVHPCSLTMLGKLQRRARRHSPPFHAIACALGSPESIEARQRLSLLRRGFHRRNAVVPPRRAAMAAAIVASADERSHQVVQSTC